MRTWQTRSIAASATFLVLILTGPHARAADFGTPPSGAIPILFNDHTVYAKPDELRNNRVLAAISKGGRIYVPLRSMFEQMGATVSVSADGKTVTAQKTGATVSVTLGKAEVIVNGETRPLDVPPMLYKGIVLVPVRVISEGLGAYVQWVPERRVVVVRYIPLPVPPPPPTPVPAAPPTIAPPRPTPAPTLAPPPPTPSPTPVLTERGYNGFVQAAYSPSNNYNELVAGGYCDTYIINAVLAPVNSAFALKADFRHDAYVTSSNTLDAFGNHYTQFATIDGGTAFTPVFMGRQDSLDIRLEYRVASPRVYVGVGYLHTTTNYGYPNLNAVGFGVEKLPDLRPGISLYGSAFYYPSASGTYTISNPTSAHFNTAYRQQYAVLKYDIGAALVIAHSPVYLFGGYGGDRYYAKQNAPIGQVHTGPYIGLGVKI
ncbi:MAG TPA: stalk domain-containing protein [Candidatus Aquilonibacter sp.]